ncbi:hemolysin family protein [Ruminococcus sp.]|uniref:hemolysin family protein n=1 Tax=Ruminococcus sp. TaxID=41978 RepID=UPI00261878C1|nr:hemolysin family protein [Ruminococcus sp.]MCI2113404.1 hemolysin family protein [Ruminococcus sp.]MDD6988446.1 hemolysin family protein [Ruminococcus sp.]MDY6200759.1 hemolysin family protein [Ruminococcus sp.]
MTSDIIMGIVIAILVLLSAFFSATETAFSFVNKIRIQHSVDNGNKKAKNALYVIENFDNALTTILICNNIVNLSCSSIATVLCLNLFGDMGSAIATGATTLLVLTFGEVIPKCLAKEHCDAFTLKTAGLLRVLMFMLKPFVFVFLKLKSLALKIAGGSEDSPSVTENELKYIVESIEEEGVLEESESEMVRSALDFDEKTAEEILTPRVDVTFININDSQEKIKDIIIENRYSRIPVYEETVDHIVGILHTRDYLESLADGKAPDLRDIMQTPYFVFRTQQLSKILNSFKRTKIHLAIVTDEYGGTLGIVTMEDLLEEIVGEIWDEDEEIEHNYYKIGKGEFLVNGDIELDDLLALFDMDEDAIESDSVTVGGFILEHAGTIPHKRQSIEADGFRFTVMEVKDQRIIRVVVKKLDTEIEEQTEEKAEETIM